MFRFSSFKDPPFTKLNLLCCRNLLIYLNTELQRRVLPMFHYSLKEDGLLFLGSSETVGQTGELFETINKKWKMYRRKTPSEATQPPLSFPRTELPHAELRPREPEAVRIAEELSALQLVETILQQSHLPPCAIVNDASNIVYIHGRTGRYLEPA